MSRSVSTVPSVPSLRECQIRASLLLKDLRSAEPARMRSAAERIAKLPQFQGASIEQVLQSDPPLQRKHALWAIALESGFPSWIALKAALDEPRMPTLDTGLFFRRVGGAFLNQWFARYEDARAVLDVEGGYLFPFRTQYFVCGSRMLEFLDIDPAHLGWARIGYDWARPADTRAFAELTHYMVELGYAA